MRRLIFLDIDGVLTSFAAHDGLDPRCLARLDALVRATHAELVLISAWRDRYGLVGTQARLTDAGLQSVLVDAVPALAGGTRSDEIRHYLALRRHAMRFVILDDVPLGEELRRRQVVVDSFVGLQQADAKRAAALVRPPRS